MPRRRAQPAPDDTARRYARQIALPEIGPAGQAKLAEARVLIIGLGGLGSPAGFYLAAAGVGTLGLMDDDTVEVSNLQRQIAHTTAEQGRPKVESAAERFKALNPRLAVELHPRRFTAADTSLLAQYDFIVDASDTFASKFTIADACFAARKPYAHAGIARYCGQALTIIPGKTACLRCTFGEVPPEDLWGGPGPVGPLGPAAGILGAVQAAEAIKWIAGCGDLLTNRWLTCDILTMKLRDIPIQRNPGCPLCGKPPDRD